MTKPTRTQIHEWRTKFPANDLKFAQYCFQQGVIAALAALDQILRYSVYRITDNHSQQAFFWKTQKAFETPAGTHSQQWFLDSSITDTSCDEQQPKPEQGLTQVLHYDAPSSSGAFRDTDKAAARHANPHSSSFSSSPKTMTQEFPELSGRSDDGTLPVQMQTQTQVETAQRCQA